MKNIVYIIIFSLIAFSCTDLLEENPKAVATSTFYNTAAELESAVYGGYGQLRYGMSYLWYLNAGEVDYAVGRLSFANMSDLDQPWNSTNISRARYVWENFYQAIRNVNLVITNAPDASEATADEINQYIAEAKFVRAFCYYKLVQNWGALPLRTEDNMSESDVPRTSVSEIYNLIVSDLEFAEANLPATQNQSGRADQYAAKTMLTHIYLHLERWADAKSMALEVINSDRYSLINIKASNDYYKIFSPEVVTSSEEIFYLKYSGLATSHVARYRHAASTIWYPGGGVYAKLADSTEMKVIREWDHNDLRRGFMLYNADIGFGPRTMLFKKFIATTMDNRGDNDYPAYRYSDILLFYAEADCRVNNGPTADGMEKLNMIHRRAYGYDVNASSPVDFNVADYNQDSFIDLILQEGMYEQMDEAKRYLELKRTGKLNEKFLENRGIQVAESHLLFPIPNTEYDYNGAIDPITDQNPGY